MTAIKMGEDVKVSSSSLAASQDWHQCNDLYLIQMEKKKKIIVILYLDKGLK